MFELRQFAPGWLIVLAVVSIVSLYQLLKGPVAKGLRPKSDLDLELDPYLVPPRVPWLWSTTQTICRLLISWYAVSAIQQHIWRPMFAFISLGLVVGIILIPLCVYGKEFRAGLREGYPFSVSVNRGLHHALALVTHSRVNAVTYLTAAVVPVLWLVVLAGGISLKLISL